MAKKEDSATKEFILPEALPFGYPFIMFVEHVINHVPEFQSVSGARKGAKLIDAVESAQEGAMKAEDKTKPAIVRWPSDLWKIVCKTLESDQFQMPRNFFQRNGVQLDQMVPGRLYIPMADAILEAEDEVTLPKSEEVAAPEPPKEAEAPQGEEGVPAPGAGAAA